jgi:hypothetical protein
LPPSRFDVKIERLTHAFDIRHRTTVGCPLAAFEEPETSRTPVFFLVFDSERKPAAGGTMQGDTARRFSLPLPTFHRSPSTASNTP